ncbi:DUF2294 domain-containing protein [Planktothrix sp. FACHB-1355]|uniref:DUF2294 domain-containing protein n=1 Tax=Aerosakkonema funiforme FACHB-1375 TaxID=2949571 RepID=A0A926VIE4_9CYAN|nr:MULTISPECIES: DUF2294 domain-containing protein [Oscillatoriales]MBD2184290.1 DUF2294 domain-containing protein [Aerosakkonema funiforme FACHB-1375]MBD3558926.1 DUF2294 domain-containing protein [Planktothrix sp. FACHB-1355]
METPAPTRGQLERTLSQRIQALYRNQLGHQPSQVTCEIFDTKIVIVLEDAVTQPEQVLVNNGQQELAEQVRSDLNAAIQPQLKDLIEEVVGVDVVDLLSDAKLDTGRTGTIVILSAEPQVRDSSASSKRRK